MSAAKLIDSLERFPKCVEPLVRSLSPEDAKWKPSTRDWSVLEILCHLRDEEVEDFRTRLRSTLENADSVWPPIDPTGVAVTRRYNDEDILDVLDSFLNERQSSVSWLRGLSQPDWQIAYVHPSLGKILAGDLLTAWSCARLAALATNFQTAVWAWYSAS